MATKGSCPNYLLTKRLLRPLRTLMWVSSTLVYAPFEWDDTAQIPIRAPRWKYRLWILKSICILLNIIFVQVRTFHMTKTNLQPMDRVVVISISAYFCLGFFLDALAIGCTEYWSDHAAKTLSTFNFVKDVMFADAKPVTPAKVHLGERIGFMSLQLGIANALAMWLYSIQFPDTAPSSYEPVLVSLLGERIHSVPIALRMIVSLLLKMWQLYAAFNVSVVGIIIFVTLLNDLVVVGLVFDKLEEKRHALFLDLQCWAYDTMAVLVRDLEVIYGFGMLGIQNAIMFMTMFSFYGIIRVGGVTGFLGAVPGINCYFLISFIYYFLANFHRRSTLALKAWKGEEYRAPPRARRALRARRFLRFTVGSSFFIDKGILLTFSKIVFDGTINLLVVTGRHA